MSKYNPILNDNFKRWFGDSKVVDENGQPLVCYHGSTVNIEEFSHNYAGDNTGNNFEKVFYFTSDEDAAITYSQEAVVRQNEWKFYDEEEKKNIEFTSWQEYSDYLRDQVFEDPKINPCYLCIENPYILDANGEVFDYKKNYTLLTILKGNMNNIDYSMWDSDIEEELKDVFYEYDEENEEYIEKGVSFDGVIIKNVIDNITDMYTYPIDEYIVWDPRQIKSVYNKGIWDMTNSNVMESILEEVVSLDKFKKEKYLDNVNDFSNSLLEMGKVANPSNPYDWVADRMEDMSNWNKKDWEFIFKHELSFKDIRDVQTTFEEMSKRIREIADAYEIADKRFKESVDMENDIMKLSKGLNEDYTDIKPNTKKFDIVDKEGYTVDTLYVTPLENGHFDYWTDMFDSVGEADTLKDISDDVKECHDNGPGAEKVRIVGLNKKAFKESFNINSLNEHITALLENDLDKIWGIEMFLDTVEGDPEPGPVEFTKIGLIDYLNDEYDEEIPYSISDEDLKHTIAELTDWEFKYIKG